MMKHFYELLWMWTWREIRVRYKQSLLGASWAMLQPLSYMLLFTVVFSYIVRIPTGNIPYPLFSYTALLPWTFVASSISAGIPSLVNNMNLITKVNMPREVIPIATIIACLLDFGVATILLMGLIIFYKVEIFWTVVWVIPLIAMQTIISLAVVLLGSALNVLYRDIRFIVPFFLSLWMYATPIIYPMDMIPERFLPIYKLNPMVTVIEGYRSSLLLGISPDFSDFIISTVLSLILLFLGILTFKRFEPSFADII